MKKKYLKIAAALLTCIAVMAFAGCGSSDANKQVAKVNDTVITQAQLDRYAALYIYSIGYDPSDITDEEKATILQQMVDTEVLFQNYPDGDEIYGSNFDDDMSQFVTSARSAEQDFLEKYDIQDEDIEYLYRANYLNSAIFTEIQNEHSEDDLIAQAKEYYEANKDSYATDPEVRASVIRVTDEGTAKELLTELKAGADFAELAYEYSDEDTSAANGGDIGFFTKSQLSEDYSDQIFNIATGELSDIIEVNGEYMIFKITDRNDTGYKSFDEVDDDIYYSFLQNYFDEKLDEMKKNDTIWISDEYKTDSSDSSSDAE